MMYSKSKVDNDVRFLYLVIVVSYFMILAHKYLFEFHGGQLRTWLPTALIGFFLAIKHFMTSNSTKISLKVDTIYTIKIMLILYIVFGLNSLFIHGAGVQYMGKYALHMYSPVVLFMLIVFLVRSNDTINRILLLLFWGGVIFALATEYGILSGKTALEGSTFAVGESMDLVTRHGSSNIGINTYAAMMIPLPLIGLYLGGKANGVLLKCLYYFAAVFLLFALVMTISRAAIISFVVGISVMLWYNFLYRPQKLTKKIKYAASVILILAVLSFIIASNKGIIVRFVMFFAQFETFASSVLLQDTILNYGIRVQEDEHLGSIEESLFLFKENPIVGVGFHKMEEVNEHNYFIRAIATNGVLSFASFILFLASMVVIARKTMLKSVHRNPSEVNMGILIYAGLIAFIFYLNAAPSEFYFYWIWFGLTAAWIRNSTRREKKIENYTT